MTATTIALLLLLGADWPRFRGPNGTGVSEALNLPVQFGAEQGWKAAIPAGSSSPIVFGDRVFVTGHDGARRLLVCLDLKTGRKLWERAVATARTERKTPPNDPASSTPVADAGGVYAFFSDFGLISYTHAGEERWRTPLGPFNPPHGMSGSPILAGDAVILAADQVTDSFVAAFDRATGRLKWRVARPSFAGGYSTPAVCGGDLVVSGPLELVAYSVATGERRWSAGNMGALPISVPVCDGDDIYVNNGGLPPFQSLAIDFKGDRNGDGKLAPEEFPDPAFKDAVLAIDRVYGNGDGAIDAKEWDGALRLMQTRNALVALRARDGKPEERWRVTRGTSDVPSPLLYRGVLWVIRDGGILTALDPASGQVWKQGRIPGAQDRFFASPVAADGYVIVAGESGKVALIKAEPQWEVAAVNDLREECYATPALADRAVILRTRVALYCFRGA